MFKSRFLLAVTISLLIVSCKNDPIDFPDYGTEAVYFPIQYPVRTLVLGEDRLDNTIDLEHAFNVGVSLGGVYENRNDRKVDFEVDTALLHHVQATDASNNTVLLRELPENYYSISPASSITIPSGSFSGLARVQLTDAFFNDPEAYKLNYVLPLRIVNSDTPILSGIPAEGITNPNPHIVSDYQAMQNPKDFTLFAIKYINPWHGTFFHRGVQMEDGITTGVFHKPDLESNLTATVLTSGYKEAIYNMMGSLRGEAYASKLTFSDDVDGVGEIVVSQAPGSNKTVTGTGKYYKSNTDFAAQHGSWLVDPKTGKAQTHLTMTLNFTVTGIKPDVAHQFTDTLVFRDNGVKFENFTVQIIP